MADFDGRSNSEPTSTLSPRTTAAANTPLNKPKSTDTNAALNYRSLLIERVHFVRWEGAATIESLHALLREAEAAHKKDGERIFSLFVAAPPFPALSGDVRQELLRLLPKLLEHAAEVHNVVLGDGFWASALRSMFAGLILAAGYRNRSFVHSTPEAALEQICRATKGNAAAILRRARVEGFPI